jgi:hypothetical protein
MGAGAARDAPRFVGGFAPGLSKNLEKKLKLNQDGID